MRGGGGELVRLADDEGVEGVALVERLGAADWPGGRRTALRAGGATKKSIWGRLLPLLLHPEHDRGWLAQQPARRAWRARRRAWSRSTRRRTGRARRRPVRASSSAIAVGGLEPGADRRVREAHGAHRRGCASRLLWRTAASRLVNPVGDLSWGDDSTSPVWKSQRSEKCGFRDTHLTSPDSMFTNSGKGGVAERWMRVSTWISRRLRVCESVWSTRVAGSGWSSGPTQFAPPPRHGRSGGRELTALRTIPFAGLLRRQ